MTMIRGKAVSEKEVIPNEVLVGEPVFVHDGKEWLNKEGHKVNVEIKSLTDWLTELSKTQQTPVDQPA